MIHSLDDEHEFKAGAPRPAALTALDKTAESSSEIVVVGQSAAEAISEFRARRGRGPARIENVSQGGLKVVIGRRFEVGTILKVEIATAGEENFSMLLAQVVRAAPESVGNWGLGCAFLQEISEEEVQGLLAGEERPQ